MVKKHFGLVEYVDSLIKARKGLNIPVVNNADVITNWRSTKNGKGLLILVPKK